MRQFLASHWTLLRHLCFGVGLLSVLFLWPTTPAQSPSVLRQANEVANFCSSRLFIKGYEAISTANDTSKVVLKAYWDVKRSQGGDVYSSKMILRGLSDEEAYKRRQK